MPAPAHTPSTCGAQCLATTLQRRQSVRSHEGHLSQRSPASNQADGKVKVTIQVLRTEVDTPKQVGLRRERPARPDRLTVNWLLSAFKG
jgi:hypothetical protein